MAGVTKIWSMVLEPRMWEYDSADVFVLTVSSPVFIRKDCSVDIGATAWFASMQRIISWLVVTREWIWMARSSKQCCRGHGVLVVDGMAAIADAWRLYDVSGPAVLRDAVGTL